jgi:hypothetical protein
MVCAVLVVLAVGGGCQGDPTSRDLNDATPPVLTLAASGTAGTNGFVDVVDGSTLQLVRGTALTLSATARDDGGVSFVEIWFTESHTCDNGDGTSSVEQGLGGAPLVRTEGTVTSTAASSSVTTGGNVQTDALRANCSYDYEVSVKGANAATAPVASSSPVAHFTVARV